MPSKIISENLDTIGYKPEEGGPIGTRKEQFSEGTFKTPPPPPYSGGPLKKLQQWFSSKGNFRTQEQQHDIIDTAIDKEKKKEEVKGSTIYSGPLEDLSQKY